MVHFSGGPRRHRLRTSALAVALALPLALAACSPSVDPASPATSEPKTTTPATSTTTTPATESQLTAAAEAFAETTGVTVEISTTGVPAKARGLTALIGTGRAVPTPAFTGTATTLVDNRITGTLQAVAVGDVTRVRYFSDRWTATQPSTYQSPNPAQLFSAGTGLGSLASALASPEAAGTTTVDGEPLLAIKGTLAGADLTRVLVLATKGTAYPATVFLSPDGAELRRIEVSGALYAGATNATMTISLRDYGQDREITLPPLG